MDNPAVFCGKYRILYIERHSVIKEVVRFVKRWFNCSFCFDKINLLLLLFSIDEKSNKKNLVLRCS